MKIESRLEEARQLIDQARYRKAEKLLKPLKEQGGIRVREMLARCYLESEKFAKALKELRALLKKDPDNPDYLMSSAQCLAYTGKMDEAKKIMASLENLAGKNPEFHYTKALLFMRDEDYSSTLKETEEALSLYREENELTTRRKRFIRLMRMVCHRFLMNPEGVLSEAKEMVPLYTQPKDALAQVEGLGSPMILHAVLSVLVEKVPELNTEQMREQLDKLEESAKQELELLKKSKKQD